MIEIISGFPDHVLAIEATGEVTEDDYRTILVPEVRAKMKKHSSVPMLFHIGPKFTGYTAGAVWEDFKVGVGNWSSWGRIAIVTDVGWIAQCARLFAPFFHHPLRVFSNAEFAAAKQWIVESEAKKAA